MIRIIYITNAKLESGVFDSEGRGFLRAARQAGARTDMIHFAAPDWRGRPGYAEKLEAARVELAPGRLIAVESPPRWKGLGAYAKAMRKALAELPRESPDRTVIHASGHLMSYSALRVRQAAAAPILADLRGALPEETWHYGAASWPIRLAEYAIARRMERRIVEQADALNCVSVAFREHLIARYGAKPERICVTPVCVDSQLFFYDAGQRREERARLGWNDSAVFLYSGRRQRWQLPECLFDNLRWLLQRLPRARGAILTVEPGAFEQDLRALGEAERKRIEIRSLPHGGMGRALRAADAGLLFRRRDLVNRVACPTKFYEYLACGLAVCCTEGIGDVSALARQKGMGWTLSHPRDREGLERVAREIEQGGILSDESRRARSAAALEACSWNAQMPRILDRYERLLRGGESDAQ
ncbi:MAG: putative glycosyl transferase [candidate division BRC1 bacterium ADurb.BinA364]|nr:MAG: putative glycosyl transferase [candidate division BRC1 bacterium ADurb.BinA364]